MFSIKSNNFSKTESQNFLSQSKKNEYSMYISINANDEKLDDKIFYYYPNESVDIDKFTIHPEKPSTYLDFYKNNLDKYEKLSKSVKLIIAFNSYLTKYNTSTGNIVKIKSGDKEKKCILTCFSLIKRLELSSDEDINKIEVYMVSNIRNLYQFLKKLDFLITLNTPREKIIFFEAIKNEYCLTPLEKDIQSLKHRTEFVKCIEFTEYDYLFRDPKTDRYAPPGLDILLLNFENKNLGSANESNLSDDSTIDIDLDEIEGRSSNVKSSQKDDFLTYVTYHIPRQKIESLLGKKKRGRISNKSHDNQPMSKLPQNNKSNMINYEEIRSLEFSKTCCVLYDRSINFGRTETSVESGLKVGYYSFNTNSAGSLLFSSEFKPIGIAYFGSFDFYPLIDLKKLYNIFLPFDHIGVLYVLKCFLSHKDDPIKLDVFLKEKNINLVAGSYLRESRPKLVKSPEINYDEYKEPEEDIYNFSSKGEILDIQANENEDDHMDMNINKIEYKEKTPTDGKISNSFHSDKTLNKIGKKGKSLKLRKKKIAPKEKNGEPQKLNNPKPSFDYPLTRSRKSFRLKKEFQESEKYIGEKRYAKKGNLFKKKY